MIREKRTVVRRPIKHGLTKHRFYKRWTGVMARCYNPNQDWYECYGGRGIRVSEEFHNPDVFIYYLESLPGYGVDGNTTIDRIDNNGHYERGNLRWASRKAQQNNTRLAKNNKSGVKGVTFNKAANRWRAFVTVKNKIVHIGYSETIEGALQKRNTYITENNLPNKIQIFEQ